MNNRNIELGCGKKQMKDGVGAQRMSLEELKTALKKADPELYSRSQAYKKKRLEVCKLLSQTNTGKRIVMEAIKKNSPKKKSPVKALSPSDPNYVNKMLSMINKKPSPNKKNSPKTKKTNVTTISLANFGLAMDPNTGEVITFEELGYNMPMPVNRKVEKDPLLVGKLTKAQAKRFEPKPLTKKSGTRVYKSKNKESSNRPKVNKFFEKPRVMSFAGNRSPPRAMGHVISKNPRLNKSEKRKARIVAGKIANLFNENENAVFKGAVAEMVQKKINKGETRAYGPVEVRQENIGFSALPPLAETDPNKLKNYYKSKGMNVAARIFTRFSEMKGRNKTKSENISKQPVLKGNSPSPIKESLNKLPGPKVEISQQEAAVMIGRKPSTFMIANKPCTSYSKTKLEKVAALYSKKPVQTFKKMTHTELCNEIEKLQKNFMN